MTTPNPIVAELVRNGFVESVHRGAVIAVRADGSEALRLGDVDRPALPRSANKPLQAAGLLAAGWSPSTEQHLTMACASHSGEPRHVDLVREVLADVGLDVDALGCPSQPPVDKAAAAQLKRAGIGPSPLTMNCSGKHAAMLATCVANGWATDGYLDPSHPVQRACLAEIERLSGETVTAIVVDGCGAPQHALTLRGLARAFVRLATEHPRVASAMRANPWLLGGTGRDVTRLTEGVDGLVTKDGAEGVHAAATADGAAVAIKVDDGSPRARVPVLVAALRSLGVDAPVLEELAESPVLGGGRVVGAVHSTISAR